MMLYIHISIYRGTYRVMSRHIGPRISRNLGPFWGESYEKEKYVLGYTGVMQAIMCTWG